MGRKSAVVAGDTRSAGGCGRLRAVRGGAIAVALLLAALVGGCGSDKVVVRTVTVEHPPPVAAVPEADRTTPRPHDARFVRCDANIKVKQSTTTCAFANNVFYEYWTGDEAQRVRAYSPAAGRFFRARCAGGDG